MSQRIQFAASVTVIVIVALPLRAEDWPQYMGPNRDGIWNETGILREFHTDGPKIAWRTDVAAGYTGPAVAADRIFVMDRVLADGAKNHDERLFPHRSPTAIQGKERVLCFNAANGKLLWKREYDCPYGVSYPLGPRCTPTVDGDLVYALGTEGDLHCLRTKDGEVVWSKDFKKEYGAKTPLWGHSAHPLVDGKKLICVVGGEGSVAVAFDKLTGKELWRALTAREQGYCAPVIHKVGNQRQLIIWHAESVNALDPETGSVYWTQPAPTYQGMSIATPRESGGSLFVTAYPNTALMLKLGVDSPSADVTWKGDRKKGFFSVFSTPHFDGGHIYGVNSGGKLTCLKGDTGERLWETTKPHGAKPEASAEVFLVKNGDRWFLANEKGDLIIAKLSPTGYEEISRAHVLSPTSTGFGREVLWSHPAFANRRAYMRNDKELVCIDLAAPNAGK